jgi:hypothetical protein
MRRGVGEMLLTSKLQILNGTGTRRPSIALSILTGRVAEQLSILENFYAADPVNETPEAQMTLVPHRSRQYAARTVYLSEAHLREIDAIIEACQANEPRRLTRSAVLRRAIEHLRVAVEADPAKFTLENE